MRREAADIRGELIKVKAHAAAEAHDNIVLAQKLDEARILTPPILNSNICVLFLHSLIGICFVLVQLTHRLMGPSAMVRGCSSSGPISADTSLC